MSAHSGCTRIVAWLGVRDGDAARVPSQLDLVRCGDRLQAFTHLPLVAAPMSPAPLGSLVAFEAGSLLLSELLEADSVAFESLLSEELLEEEPSLELDLLSAVSLAPFSAGRLGRP